MLTLSDVTVSYGDHLGVDGVDLLVPAQGVVALLGPSGSGKSTLLRAVAGIEPLASGQVRWGVADLTEVPPHRRDFGLMFQDHVLFPHRDVAGNVEFGLRMHGVSADVRRARVDEVLELVGLTGFAHRAVDTLSGGEAQRVALARTLAPRPRMVMLDEPLGSLDRDLRDRLVGELRRILGRAGVPALYVTHDHAEAFAVADKVAVMREGTIVQVDSPERLWMQPADEWVAGFLGFGAAIDGRMVRPGGWRLDPSGAISGRVVECRFRGERWEALVGVRSDAPPTVVWCSGPVAVGAEVRLSISPDHVVTFH